MLRSCGWIMCGTELNWTSCFLVDGKVWRFDSSLGTLDLLEQSVLVGDI